MLLNFRSIILILLLSVIPTVYADDLPIKQSDSFFIVSNTDELFKAVSGISKSGGTISMKPGNYVIDKPIVFDNINLVTLMGSGWDTQITRKGDGDAIIFKSAGFCFVKNLMIIGDKEAKTGSGIVFEPGCSSSTVDTCRICMFPDSGIYFNGGDVSAQSSNSVLNCHLINNGGDQLKSYQNNDFYIIGNQFGHDRWGRGSRPRSGCLLEKSSAGTYSKNYHWGNVNAFKMISSNFNRIENNRFEESSESGMAIGSDVPWSGGAYNIIIGNTIHTNSQGSIGKYPAVTVKNASVFQFCLNQIFSWDSNSTKMKNGLVLDSGCSKWIIKDNVIHHNTEKAIIYQRGSGHIVKDNIIN